MAETMQAHRCRSCDASSSIGLSLGCGDMARSIEPGRAGQVDWASSIGPGRAGQDERARSIGSGRAGQIDRARSIGPGRAAQVARSKAEPLSWVSVVGQFRCRLGLIGLLGLLGFPGIKGNFNFSQEYSQF